MRKPVSPTPAPMRGIALVITLCMLALITILVVGFTSSMRTERQAAHSLAESERARLIAQSALAHATSLLANNIPNPVPPGTPPTAANWSLAPGRLVVNGQSLDLSSGAATGTGDADLNVPSALSTASGATASALILGPNPAPMRVAWLPMQQDPTKNPSATNRLVGRYAFWIDDENSKVNLSTAYGKPASASHFNPDISASHSSNGSYTSNWNEHVSVTYGLPNFPVPDVASFSSFPFSANNPVALGHPNSVNLDLLPGMTAAGRDQIWTAAQKARFASPADVEAALVQAGITTAQATSFYEQNRFWLTFSNADPEFNTFGKSRIFVTGPTAQINGGGDQPYGNNGMTYVPEPSAMTVRDATEPLTFHSDIMAYTVSASGSALSTSGNPASNLSGVNVAGNPAATAVARLCQYFSATWPGYTGTFVGKWGAREADQIAWNIYAMNAAAVSPVNAPSVARLRDGTWANTTPAASQSGVTRFSQFLWNGPLSGARILPQTRSAYISKVTVGITPSWSQRSGSGFVTDPATNASIRNTQKFVINLRIYPEISLPLGYYGTTNLRSNVAHGYEQGNSPDRIFITHLEATVNDGTNGDRTVRWSSETPTDDSSLYWDATGGNGTMKSLQVSTNQSFVMPIYDPTDISNTYNYKLFYTPSTTGYDLGSFDTNGTRSLSFIFDSGSKTNPKPCVIKNLKLRFVVATSVNSNTSFVPYQISPIRDVDGAPGFEAATLADAGVIVFPELTVLPSPGNLGTNRATFVSMETLDPRVNQRGSTPGTIDAPTPPAGDDWQPSPNYGTPLDSPYDGRSTNLGSFPNVGTYGDESKCAMFDASSLVGVSLTGASPDTANRRFSSAGIFGNICTGMQRGRAWSTLEFHKGAASNSPPDWLLLDLFAVPYNRVDLPVGQTSPNATFPVPFTFMNATAGKVNLNALIFPQNSNFNLSQTGTATRDLPIRALLRNAPKQQAALAGALTGGTIPADSTVECPLLTDAEGQTLFANLVTYLNAKPNGTLDYPGEICEVPGFADGTLGTLQWDQESLVRNLASLVTTRSNTFSVWGVAQTVQQSSISKVYNALQTHDTITGEHRFHAIIERYVWPGVDGVPGNGSLTSTYGYDNAKLGASAWVGSPTNVIDASDPTQGSFEQAANPGAAKMKYRVIYYEVLQ